MGRPRGTTNATHAETRARLAACAAQQLQAEGAVSVGGVAAAAAVSTPTVRHYFGDAHGLAAAAVTAAGVDGAPHYAFLEVPTTQDLRTSMQRAAEYIVVGWRDFGVGRVFSASLAVGFTAPVVGHATVNGVIEPLIQAIEARLRAHVDDGAVRAGLSPLEVRAAALAFVSPLIVALLHQDALDGVNCRALDVDAYVVAHVDAFCRAYGGH